MAKRSHASVTCSELSSTIMTRSNDRSFKLKSRAGERYDDNVKFDKRAICGVPDIGPNVPFVLEPGIIDKQRTVELLHDKYEVGRHGT